MIKEYGYEYNALVKEELLSKTQWKSTNKTLWGALCLRSGRDALKVIARAHSGLKVYLPSLCCDSMITPFEMYNCKIEFYPLTETLSVDFCKLQKKLECSFEKAVLLFYDYFGIPMFSDTQLKEIKVKYKNLVLVRDITHNLLSYNRENLNTIEDYTIASLRKWTNIPDGGLLWTNREVNQSDAELYESPTFAMQRLEAQRLRTVFFETGNEEIKKHYREMFSYVSSLLDADNFPVKMTEYSFQISANTDWEQIKNIRKENADILYRIFDSSIETKLINCDKNQSNLYVPIIVNNRDRIQARLSQQGIFNTVIWPLRDIQMKCCKNANYVCTHMLAVPCDQRYSKEEMTYIGKEIARTIHEEINDSWC